MLSKTLTRTVSMLPGFEVDETQKAERERQSAQQVFAGVGTAIAEESSRYANEGHAPWLDEDGNLQWTPARVMIAKVVCSQQFEGLMGVVIMFNLWLIMFEADYTAQCYPQYRYNIVDCPWQVASIDWVRDTNLALLMLYTVEAGAHFYVHQGRYFFSKWNILDLTVVLVGWGSLFLKSQVNVAWLRIFRIARLMRAFRMVLSIRELYLLVTGLISSFKAIFFGSILLLVMLVLWSVVLVEFVHPVNSSITWEQCDRCPRGFNSVSASTLTLFQQIIAGDSWGLISVPVMEKDPKVGMFLILVVLSVSLGSMNLILAVIVESAAEAREKDVEEKFKAKRKEQSSMKLELLKMCADIDKDKSGSVTLDEMQNAWQTDRNFRRVMSLLDVSENDLGRVFSLLDTMKTGEVDYKDFVDKVYELRNNENRMMLALTSLSELEAKIVLNNSDFHRRLRHQSEVLAKHTEMLESMGGIPCEKVDVDVTTAFDKFNCMSPPVAFTPPDDDEFASPRSPRSPLPPSPVPRPIFLKPPMPKADSKACPVSQALSVEIPASSLDMSEELEDLQRRINDLSSIETSVLRQAEEQVAVLQRHSEYLTRLREALAEPVENGAIAARMERTDQLREELRQRFSGLLMDKVSCVTEQAAALAASGGLVEAIGRGSSASQGNGYAGASRERSAAQQAGLLERIRTL